jgi:hypothetical protein
MSVSVTDKMASGYGVDGIEVAETSFNMKSDEYKGVKEGVTEENGTKPNVIHFCNVHCIFPLEVAVCVLVGVWHDRFSSINMTHIHQQNLSFSNILLT